MNPPVAIEARRLAKTFPPSITAVNRLDLRVPTGSVYGLIGRNGAGKSTLLRCLMGLMRADSGGAEVLGHDLWTAPPEVRRRVAYVSHGTCPPRAGGCGRVCHWCPRPGWGRQW